MFLFIQTKNSSYNNNAHTSDEEDGYNGGRMDDDRPNDVRMASTTANKSHSWRGEHPIKDQNGYVGLNYYASFIIIFNIRNKES